MNNRVTQFLILGLSLVLVIALTVPNWNSSQINHSGSKTTANQSKAGSFDEASYLLAISEIIADNDLSIEEDFPLSADLDADSTQKLITKAVAQGLAPVAAYYTEKQYGLSSEDSFLLQSARYLVVASNLTESENHNSIFLLKALSLLELYLVQNPNSEDAQILKAYTLVRTNPAPMEGIALLLEVLEKNPNQTDALYLLGQFSIESQQFEKAVERFKKLLSLQPSNPDYYFKLSEIYSKMELKDSSNYYLNKGIEARKREP